MIHPMSVVLPVVRSDAFRWDQIQFHQIMMKKDLYQVEEALISFGSIRAEDAIFEWKESNQLVLFENAHKYHHNDDLVSILPAARYGKIETIEVKLNDQLLTSNAYAVFGNALLVHEKQKGDEVSWSVHYTPYYLKRL